MLDMILCVQFVNYVTVLLCIFNTNNVIVMSAFDYQVASFMPVERNVVYRLPKTLNIKKSAKKCIRSLYVLECPLNGEENDVFKITFVNLPKTKSQYKQKMRPTKLGNFDVESVRSGRKNAKKTCFRKFCT